MTEKLKTVDEITKMINEYCNDIILDSALCSDRDAIIAAITDLHEVAIMGLAAQDAVFWVSHDCNSPELAEKMMPLVEALRKVTGDDQD